MLFMVHFHDDDGCSVKGSVDLMVSRYARAGAALGRQCGMRSANARTPQARKLGNLCESTNPDLGPVEWHSD